VMALVMFFGGAWAYLRLLKLPVPPGDPGALPAAGGSLLSNGSVLLALAVLAVTGVLGGVLVAVPRISPLAAGLPGLLLIAWTVLYLVSVRWATTVIPMRSYSFGAGWEALLFNGVLGAAGLVMIVPMFIPARWRDESLPSTPARRPADRARADRATADWRGADRASADRASADRGGRPRPAQHATGPITGPVTGPLGAPTGPFRPASRPPTGPIDARTGPIRTSSPIRTTGPIRLKPPGDR
jgi:hypothetical protein